MRLRHGGAVAGGRRRPARGADPGAVHRRDARGGQVDPRPGGPRRDGDRNAAPAQEGEPGGALGAGQPRRGVPLHEDDHPGGAGDLPARRRDRSGHRPGRGRPGPSRGRGHDRHSPGPGARLMTQVAGVNDGAPALRTLPAVRAGWRRDADVVVVGSGAAGIAAALTAAGQGLRVVLVTKELAGGATPLAQGGLAAAIGPGDSAAAHAADTLTAGAGLSEPEVVAELAAGAPEAIRWVADLGARLEQRALHLEGGHSRHRVAHAGDATGAEVHRALRAALLASDVEILDRTVALDLILRDPDAADWDRAGISAARRAGHGLAAANAGLEGRLSAAPLPAQRAPRARATMIVGNSQRISRETPHDHEFWGAAPARAVGGVLVAGTGPGGELDAGA